MSIQHNVTYKWARGSDSLSVTREITAAVEASLDWPIPDASVNLKTTSLAFLLAKVQSIFLYCDQAITLKSGGTNEVQTLSTTGTVTAGTFTITYSGQTTGAIAYNATATTIQAALEALSNIAPGDVTLTGGPLPATPVVIEYTGTLALTNVAAITTTDTLTGGSTAVATTTGGAAATTTLNLLAGVPLVWDADGYFAQPFAADVSGLWATNASGTTANLKVRTLSNS